MRRSYLLLLSLSVLFLTHLQFQAHAAPAVSLIRQFSSLLRWPKSSSRTPQSDGNFLQYEEGYLVETVVEGNAIGVVPYKIRVSEDGELYAVDSVNSNIVKITPPLSQYSRARLIAGSFQGYTGHVDGKPSEARFNRPRGVTMDDKGNVYVADTSNLAIRKIGEGGVTTIAGGKSNIAGYRDGPSEGAMFSTDFDVIYVRPTCSLLVVDRGNAALRQISLNQEDCNYEYSSISTTDVTLVFVAVLIGYATCMLQQGFKPSFLSKLGQKYSMEGNTAKTQQSKEKPTPVVETVKPELEAGWPSFGILVVDLIKLALEALGSVLLYLVPVGLRPDRLKGGLTPLKDSLIMPEDEPESMSAQKQRTPTPLTETRQVQASPTGAEKYSEPKPTKMRSSSSLKDPSLSSKHRSSKRQDYSEFYGSGEVPPGYSQHSRSKSQKERTKHRQREKSGEVGFGGVAMEQKPVEQKPVNYEDPNFTHYRNNKYGDSYRFQ